MKKRVKKKAHGGRREGAGRKPSLERPSLIVARFSEQHMGIVDRFAVRRELPSRSSALRAIVEEVEEPKGK